MRSNKEMEHMENKQKGFSSKPNFITSYIKCKWSQTQLKGKY